MSAVTGDLTVGVGFGTGDYVAANATTDATAARLAADIDDVSVMTAGAKYVSGDITFNVGASAGDGKDEVLGQNVTGAEDSSDVLGASVDYAIASGVTGTVGYRSQDSGDDGSSANTFSGSSWYVGATVSF